MDKRYYLERCDTEGRERLAVPRLPCVIGRDPSCDLLLDENRISRQHARLSIAPEGLLIEDLGSTNGSFVDCRRIEAPTLLQPGQRLHLADHELELVIDRPGGATLVQARSGPAPGDTIIGYTGDPAGFPLLAPAFYELLNQCLIEIEHTPIKTPAGLPHAELLRCRSRHRSLPADSADLMNIGRELGEEARLGTLLRDEALQAADAADLGPRLFIEQHTAESDAPASVFDELDRKAAEYPHLELIVLLIGPVDELIDWLKVLAGRVPTRFRLALEGADAALADHLPLPVAPNYLQVRAADFSGDDMQALIASLKAAGSRTVAVCGDSGAKPPEAADLVCQN